MFSLPAWCPDPHKPLESLGENPPKASASVCSLYVNRKQARGPGQGPRSMEEKHLLLGSKGKEQDQAQTRLEDTLSLSHTSGTA